VARNRGKPSIRDLSRVAPTREEANAVTTALADTQNSPMVTALLGQAAIEHELDTLLRTKFSKKDDETWRLLTSEVGPLSTFASKIMAGYAFGLYGENERKNLSIVKDIRNAFAHSKRLIEFDDVADALRDIKVSGSTRAWQAKGLQDARDLKYGSRHSYVILCFSLLLTIIKRQRRGVQASARNSQRSFKRWMKEHPLAAELLGPQTGGIKSFEAALLGGPGWGTIPPPPSEAGPGLLVPPIWWPHSKGK
jgi:hypothetical protein